MSRKPGDAYYCEFVTANFSTGAAQSADALPTATANHNGIDDAGFALTVAALDTGRYKITGAVPVGYVAGDTVAITVSAAVGGVSAKATVDSFTIDAKRISDLNDLSNAQVQTDLAGPGYGVSGSLPRIGNLYCTAAEIQAVWSAFGVNVRLDDDLDGVADQDISAVIEQATSRINGFVLRRYAVDACTQSTWLKWCCATFSAALLARRRGNDIPQSLIDETKDYRDLLDEIKAGSFDLPADDGPAAPLSDESPAISNLTIDGRWTRAKIRRVPTTSTGGPQANNGRIQSNAIDYALWE